MILESNEKQLWLIRKHWFILVMMLLPFLLLALIPVSIGVGLLTMFIEPPVVITNTMINGAVFLYFIWLIVLWTGAFMVWTDWYLDLWIITEDRLVHIDQKGLFNREVSSMRYERIQDITSEVPGIIPTVFGFGVLHVQSAGEEREMEMQGICKPREVKEFILTQLEQVIERVETVRIADDASETTVSRKKQRNDV